MNLSSRFQKGDLVTRAYNFEPEEWGLIIGFEYVNHTGYEDAGIEEINKTEYLTVLWPDSYTTQEIDYELIQFFPLQRIVIV